MKKRVVGSFLLLLFLSAVGAAAQAYYQKDGPALLPDPRYTPGFPNPNVTQSTVQQTICVKHWTKTIRPPSSYTDKLKLELMQLYGDTAPQVPPLPVIITTKIVRGKKVTTRTVDVSKCIDHSDDPRCYELDHDESLEVGGHPTDRRNLWPQPYWPKPAAHEKDQVENWWKRQVCSGAMTLESAQHAIATDWYRTYLVMQRKTQK